MLRNSHILSGLVVSVDEKEEAVPVCIFSISRSLGLKRLICSDSSVSEHPMQYLLNPLGLMRNVRSIGKMGEGMRLSRFSSITTNSGKCSSFPVAKL